jgi:hypothetical protein
VCENERSLGCSALSDTRNWGRGFLSVGWKPRETQPSTVLIVTIASVKRCILASGAAKAFFRAGRVLQYFDFLDEAREDGNRNHLGNFFTGL